MLDRMPIRMESHSFYCKQFTGGGGFLGCEGYKMTVIVGRDLFTSDNNFHHSIMVPLQSACIAVNLYDDFKKGLLSGTIF